MGEVEKKKRITFTLDPAIIEGLREVSKQTMIPQSRLVEKALLKVIEDYRAKE